MIKIPVILLMVTVSVFCYVPQYRIEQFRVGIEYTKSLPMRGQSDRFRHRNNYDPFFVTLTTTAKKGYVITYLDMTATVDAGGEISFTVIRGQPGSTSMVFQLVSNHSDFLSYSYLAHGMKEEDYRKITNVITIPMPNNAWRTPINVTLSVLCTLLYSLINIITL